MGIPVKLKVDGFVYLGEEFNKGDIFNAPTEMFASYLCEQEGTAERINESECEPENGGTMKLKSKKGSYNTKVMAPETGDTKPVKTKTKTVIKSKSNVKAKSDAASENT